MFTKKDETIILVVTAIISVLWVFVTLNVAERARSANNQSADVVVVK